MRLRLSPTILVLRAVALSAQLRASNHSKIFGQRLLADMPIITLKFEPQPPILCPPDPASSLLERYMPITSERADPASSLLERYMPITSERAGRWGDRLPD